MAVGLGWAGAWKPGQVLEAAGSKWSSAESPGWSAATFTGHQIICSQARGPGKPTTRMPFSPCCAVVRALNSKSEAPEVGSGLPDCAAGNDLDLVPPQGTGETKARSGSQPKVCRHRGNAAAVLRGSRAWENAVVPLSGAVLVLFPFF